MACFKSIFNETCRWDNKDTGLIDMKTKHGIAKEYDLLVIEYGSEIANAVFWRLDQRLKPSSNMK